MRVRPNFGQDVAANQSIELVVGARVGVSELGGMTFLQSGID